MLDIYVVTTFVHPTIQDHQNGGCCVGVYRITSANWFDNILTPVALWNGVNEQGQARQQIKVSGFWAYYGNNNQHDILLHRCKCVYPQFIVSCHEESESVVGGPGAVGGWAWYTAGTPWGLEGKQSALATCHHTYTHNAAPSSPLVSSVFP